MIHQLAPEVKTAKANFIINNNEDLAHLQQQVEMLYQHLTQE